MRQGHRPGELAGLVIDLTARLLAETGVALAPGVDFDPVDGGRFGRMCFAGDGEEIMRAVELMGDWLRGR